MSLLNDALRAAEERQRRPEVTAAYTGATVQGNRNGVRWFAFGLLVLLLLAAGVGLYWFAGQGASAPVPVATQQDSGAGQGTVQRSAPAQPPEPAPVAAPSTPSPTEASALEPEPAPEIVADPQPEPGQAEEPAAAVAGTSPEPAPVSLPKQPVTTERENPVAEAETETAENSEQAVDSASQAEAPVVKTTPRSPEAMDRQTAGELENLLANGQVAQAERKLADLVESQRAPRSRFVVARSLLVDGETSRALRWLPEEATAGDAPLRMLRARALHAQGQLDAVIATLQSQLPPVADNPEYRVTLATLLQQQGQAREAASHWAELIAWDDSRAPWWVGLAVALEDQGEIRSAARAYEQAAALPGLPPSLADYVQRRLQSLRAG